MTKKDKKNNELPKPKLPKTQKPPAIDKLMKPAIAVGVALLAWQFMRGLKSEIPRVNVHDELELREVFFGEGVESVDTTDDAANSSASVIPSQNKAYAVLCHKDDVESAIPVSSVFQEAFMDGTAPAEFRLVDCEYVLPSSGKSIADRFKLNLKTRPTIFVSGSAVDKVKQVPTKHLKTGPMLVKALKSLLEPKTQKIETTQDLRNKCLNHDMCAILFKTSSKKSVSATPTYIKDAMTKLIPEYPNVKFVSVDSTVLYVKNLEDLIPELDEDNPLHYRMAVMKKISGSASTKDDDEEDNEKNKKREGRLITSMATTEKSLSYGVMSNLIADVVTGKEKMTKLSSLPQIKTRTKKLVQEEKAKRERRSEQYQRQQQKSASGSSGSSTGGGDYFNQFADNDGSREGRKAERERRRAEHYAEKDIKPKTPEELAELERQRRIRMAEEEAKWNVGTEEDYYNDGGDEGGGEEGDMPPTGGETIVEEDVVQNDNGGGDDDDEDVLDLD